MKAEDLGMVPVANVSKKCDLLVAADISSMSGKAKKAQDIGVPVASVEDFLLIQIEAWGSPYQAAPQPVSCDSPDDRIGGSCERCTALGVTPECIELTVDQKTFSSEAK